jgi:hypothetical protein
VLNYCNIYRPSGTSAVCVWGAPQRSGAFSAHRQLHLALTGSAIMEQPGFDDAPQSQALPAPVAH